MFLSKNCKKWFETYRASFISVCAMVLLLIAAVFCHLFGWKDAPFQFLAACLGAGVTVIITNLLLVEQTKQQGELQKEEAKAQSDLQDKVKAQNLEQAKKTEQYKEKLRIYQKFLEELYTVVKDRDLSTEEKINMQFQTAYLAIHTDVGRIEEVSANLKDIIDCLISPSGNNYDIDRLQQALFNIVRQFREELYEEKVSVGDDYTAIINNFVKAFSPDGDDNNTGNDASLWSEKSDRTPSTLGCRASSFHQWVDLGDVGMENYVCKKCGLHLESHRTPSTLGCTASSFHQWVDLGHIGCHTYQCRKCGLTIHGDDKTPSTLGCTAASFHQWNKLN